MILFFFDGHYAIQHSTNVNLITMKNMLYCTSLFARRREHALRAIHQKKEQQERALLLLKVADGRYYSIICLA